MWAPVDHLLGVLMNMLSRKNEFEADAYAVELGYSKGLQSGLVKLQLENLGNMVSEVALLHSCTCSNSDVVVLWFDQGLPFSAATPTSRALWLHRQFTWMYNLYSTSHALLHSARDRCSVRRTPTRGTVPSTTATHLWSRGCRLCGLTFMPRKGTKRAHFGHILQLAQCLHHTSYYKKGTVNISVGWEWGRLCSAAFVCLQGIT